MAINFGRNAGIGIGAAIIGGVILSEAARSAHRRDHGSDWERCAETYRSFEPRTGMYTGYDGVRRTCPPISTSAGAASFNLTHQEPSTWTNSASKARRIA